MKLVPLFENDLHPVLATTTIFGQNWLFNKNNVEEKVSFDHELPLFNGYDSPSEQKLKSQAFHLYRSGKDFICVFWNKAFIVSNVHELNWLPFPNKEGNDSCQFLVGINLNREIEFEFFSHIVQTDSYYDNTVDVTTEYISHHPIGTLSSEFVPYFSSLSSRKAMLSSFLKIEYKKSVAYYCPKHLHNNNNMIPIFQLFDNHLQSYCVKDVFYKDKNKIIGSQGILDLESFRFYILTKLYRLLKEPYQKFSYHIFNNTYDTPLILVTREKYLDKYSCSPNFLTNLMADEFFIRGVLYDVSTESLLHTTDEERFLPYSQKEKNYLLCDKNSSPHIILHNTSTHPIYEVCLQQSLPENPLYSYNSLYTEKKPTVIYCSNYNFEIIFLTIKQSLNPSCNYFEKFATSTNIVDIYNDVVDNELNLMLIVDFNRQLVKILPYGTFKELIEGNVEKTYHSRHTKQSIQKSNPTQLDLFMTDCGDVLMIQVPSTLGLNPFYPILDVINLNYATAREIEINRTYSSYKAFYASNTVVENMDILKEIKLTHTNSNFENEIYVITNFREIKSLLDYINEQFKNGTIISS